MPLELIYKACDICCSKLSKPDLNYIDGILNNFKNSNIFSLKDLEKYESNKNSISKNFSNKSINKIHFQISRKETMTMRNLKNIDSK